MSPRIDSLSFVSAELAGQLLKRLRNITGDQAQELILLRDEFADPYELAEFYVEPYLQDRPPASRYRDIDLPVPRQAAFLLRNRLIAGGSRGGKGG